MKFRRLLVLAMVIVLALQLGVYANATGIQDEPRSPTEFALDQVAAVITEDISCPWTSETTIDSITVLYNMQREPNGYIFKLKTGINDCGYIQIQDYDGVYALYGYAYCGGSEVQDMAEYWGIDLKEVKYIYFLSAYNYLFEGENGEYINASSNTPCELSYNELTTFEQNYAKEIKADPHSLDKTHGKAVQSVVVPYASEDDFNWPIMSAFEGMSITYGNKTQSVHDHCTPTAATAIIRCLKHLGRTKCSTGETTKQTFKEMYIALNTNNIRFAQSSGVGTYRPQIDVGIRYYAQQNGYSINADRITLVTFAGMKRHLNAKRLLLASLNSLDGPGGHSVVVTGYTSNNELYIQDGWKAGRRKLSFDSLSKNGNIAQYVYVGS